MASVTVPLLTFCVSFTLFRRQWRRLFSNPQQFFRGTSGRFLHIVDEPPTTTRGADSSFLYLSVAEFQALSELARATLRRPLNNEACNTTNYATINHNPSSGSPVALPPQPIHSSRVYPPISAPIYSESSS